jgi:hypothetical protein
MENKIISALLILGAWLLIQPLTGQIAIPATYQVKHSYQSVNEVFYLLEDTLTLSPAERIEASHSLEIYQTDRYLLVDGQKNTYLSLLGSGSGETWMNTPAYFVINQEGGSAYDQNQNLLYHAPHSEFYEEKAAMTGPGFFPSFPVLSDDRKEELQQAGMLISGDPMNTTFRFGNRILKYHQANKTLTIKELDDQQNLINSTQIGFVTLSGGENVMSYLKEVQSVKLSAGTCAKKVSIKTFSNHQVNYGKNKTPKSVLVESSLTVSPNPVQDEMILGISGIGEEMGVLRIFNAGGRLVMTETMPFRTSNRIQVQNLARGTYLLHLQAGKINETIRFIKN